MNFIPSFLLPKRNSDEQPSKIQRKRKVVKSFEAKLLHQRSLGERLADFLNHFSGNLRFAMFHFIWFAVWIVWNLGFIEGLKPFDPFPFGLLTMVVSLEAIFLAIFVLISQNREAKIDKLRSEVDLQINLTAEQEITKVLSMVKILLEKSGTDMAHDVELARMLKQIDARELERKLESDLRESRKSLF